MTEQAVPHPARFQGITRQAARDLAREEAATLDERIHRALDLDPEGQRWLAARARRRIKWFLLAGLPALLFVFPVFSVFYDMLEGIGAALRGDLFMWKPVTDKGTFVGAMRFTLFAYPVFAALAIAGCLVRGSETQKRLGIWIGPALTLVVVSGIAVLLLVNGT